MKTGGTAGLRGLWSVSQNSAGVTNSVTNSAGPVTNGVPQRVDIGASAV